MGSEMCIRDRDVAILLRDILKNGGRSIGIANLISKAFSSSLEIFVNDEIKELYSKNPEFASFFTGYLVGRPGWLR